MTRTEVLTELVQAVTWLGLGLAARAVLSVFTTSTWWPGDRDD